MRTLILKRNATGDVVRTTSLLRRISGDVVWITAAGNAALITGLAENVCCVPWAERERAVRQKYDVVINLEDELEVATFVASLDYGELFGAYLDGSESVAYTDSSRGWFDMSLISRYGRERADQLKFQNRQTYQALVFSGLGWSFGGERYVLPSVGPGSLSGDVALSPVAGPVWPMKNWAFYPELKRELESVGFHVNVLPRRSSLLEHLADVKNHRCLVSGDSLPMHLALGSSVRCVTLFNCTSPWEIYDYGLQTKIVSPMLATYFYGRGHDSRAVSAIQVEQVYDAVIGALRHDREGTSVPPAPPVGPRTSTASLGF